MYSCFCFCYLFGKIWSIVILIFVKLYTFACSFRILVVSLLLLRHYYVLSRSLDGKENVLVVFGLLLYCEPMHDVSIGFGAI